MITVNDRNYHVEISGEGVPILLLHGFTGDVSTWETVRKSLETDYQVIATDILGHGQSDKPDDMSDYYMELIADDVIAMLDSFAIDKAHLLGYSMGGRLALYLAIHNTDRFHSLTLESASPGLKTAQERNDRRDRDNALANKIEVNGIEWFVDYWETLSLWDSQKSLPQDVIDIQRAQRLQNDLRGLANSLRGMGTGVQPNLWDQLDRLMLPTQLIVGEHDDKFRNVNCEMAEMMPHVALTIIDGAGHTVHLENPTAFIKQVQIFLNAV